VAGHYRAPARLLAELGITEPEDIDLDDIAFACGALVVREPLTGCEARLLGHGDRAVITVNANIRSTARQRFSVGHEIGHWMHHRSQASFRCTKRDFIQSWGDPSPEKDANTYAADILLPPQMYAPRVKGRDMTLAIASDMAELFGSSLTASAIRLVNVGSSPAIVLCSGASGIIWRAYGTDVRIKLPLRDRPTADSVAYDLLRGTATPGPTNVSASAWFIDPAAPYHEICEDSRLIGDDVLSILWWRDESHLLAIMGYPR
jgi:Zn-dependent peptidase ImmA (M78 family)